MGLSRHLVMQIVDGTHISIKCPAENSLDYFCYKQYHSLSVCNYRGYFIDVECMWPGSVHDTKVFTNSSINMKLRTNKLPATYQTPVEGRANVPNYFISDPAYPLLPFCIKEYKTCTSNEEVISNNMLRAARNPIECAFGRLKARWAILTRKIDLKLETIPKVVYACFVLHNYCEKERVYVWIKILSTIWLNSSDEMKLNFKIIQIQSIHAMRKRVLLCVEFSHNWYLTHNLCQC